MGPYTRSSRSSRSSGSTTSSARRRQNILALRFANGLFEPIWNRNHIDHIQIDVPETLAVGGRAGFYEGTGRSVTWSSHLFQVLAFVAMEPPTALAPMAIAEEKVKVFRSLGPLDRSRRTGAVRGISLRGRGGPELANGDVHCPGVPDRQLALVRRPLLSAYRQADGGARIISIAFREPPQSMFPAGSGIGKYEDHLTFDLDESARLSLSFYGKRPGPSMMLDKLSMQFSLVEIDHASDTLEAYERLIRDAMNGDHTLFTTATGIERLWEVSTPLLEHPPEVLPYAAGSWARARSAT